MILNCPNKLVIDADDNLYIANSGADTVVKLSPEGDLLLTIGSGLTGFEDGDISTAKFDFPCALALDKTGVLYVADSVNHAIRKVKNNTVSTLIGHPEESPYLLYSPESIVVDSEDNVLVADSAKNVIYKITPNVSVYQIAGSAAKFNYKTVNAGFSDGTGCEASFSRISAMTIDDFDNLFVADTDNFCIRRVTPEGKVTTLRHWFAKPSQVVIDPDFNLYVASQKEGIVYKINQASNVAFECSLNTPSGLAINSKGELFITDSETYGLYKLSRDKKLTRIL